MATIDSRFIDEIDHMLHGAPLGLKMSRLSSCIERNFLVRDGKPPNYLSYGVTNIQELFLKLGDQKKVVLLKKPESEMLVMSVSYAKAKYTHIKLIVKLLLDKHGGEIPFNSFERFYMDLTGWKWNPFHFGLADLDELCHVLQGIVSVGVDDSREKVIKAVQGSLQFKKKEDK